MAVHSAQSKNDVFLFLMSFPALTFSADAAAAAAADLERYLGIIGNISYALNGFPDEFISEVASHYMMFIAGRQSLMLRRFPLEHMQLAFYDLYKRYYYEPVTIDKFNMFFHPYDAHAHTHTHRGILHVLQEDGDSCDEEITDTEAVGMITDEQERITEALSQINI